MTSKTFRTCWLGSLLMIVTFAPAQVPTSAPTQTPRESRAAAKEAAAEAAFVATIAKLPRTIKFIRDVHYAKDDSTAHRLDLYLPANGDGPFPVVIFIHGGGWTGGSKNSGSYVSRYVPEGLAVASITYRLSGEAKFPAQIFDCKTAVRFLRASAKEYKLDGARIAVAGASAGGHLAALLGTSAGVKELEGDGPYQDQPSDVIAVLNICGPTDLFAWVNKETPGKDWTGAGAPVGKLLGGSVASKEDIARLASPITHLDPSDPPFMLSQGDKDAIVPVEMMDNFFDALKAQSVPAIYVRVKNGPHGVSSAHPNIRDITATFLKQRLLAAGPDGKSVRTPQAELVELEAVTRPAPDAPGNSPGM